MATLAVMLVLASSLVLIYQNNVMNPYPDETRSTRKLQSSVTDHIDFGICQDPYMT